MPRQSHRPRIYVCTSGTARTCQSGFSTMSGLTRHRNAMHPPLNNRIQLSPVRLPSFPPPDDMDLDDGDDNPGPHEPIQGDVVQTLCHPILNGMSFIHTFLFYFQQSLIQAFHVIPSEIICLLVPFLYLTPCLGKIIPHTMTGIHSTIAPNSRLPISYTGETKCRGHKLTSYSICGLLVATTAQNHLSPATMIFMKPSTPYN